MTVSYPMSSRVCIDLKYLGSISQVVIEMEIDIHDRNC